MARFSDQTLAAMGGGRGVGRTPSSTTNAGAADQAATVAGVNGVSGKIGSKLGAVDDQLAAAISLPTAFAIAAVVWLYMKYGD